MKMIKINDKFDLLLGGGLHPRNITHIYGPPGSGKTNIALIATANAAKNGRVIYIDPEGGFSVERMKQISGELTNDVLGNVMLIEPTDFDEQKVAIKKLRDIVPNMNQNSNSFKTNPVKNSDSLGKSNSIQNPASIQNSHQIQRLMDYS